MTKPAAAMVAVFRNLRRWGDLFIACRMGCVMRGKEARDCGGAKAGPRARGDFGLTPLQRLL